MDFVLKKLENVLKIDSIVNLHFFEFQKEFYTKEDRHPFYELVFVSSGKLYINSESFKGVLNKNQMIVHKPNEMHSLTCSKNNSPIVIIIGFTCSNDKLLEFSSSPVTLSSSMVKKLAEIVKEGRNVFLPPYDTPLYDMKKKKNAPFGAEQLLENLLEYFFINLLRSKISAQNKEDNIKERLMVSEIVNYLDANYKEKITIDDLAFLFGTNRTTLCREFKNYTNKTVTEYYGDLKLKKAIEYIINTDKTFTEIAETLNFISIHYFTRFFKKHTGVSPKAYRDKNK